MYRKVNINQLDDFFIQLSSRKEKGIYFYRINTYNEEIDNFLTKYIESARQCGIIINCKIPNPDEKQLSYYNEIIGKDFHMEQPFFNESLKKWLPRLDDRQRENISNSLYSTLYKLQTKGKNLNMLKNAYIKFMCWLYYKFDRILKNLGQENLPKLLYEGNISVYELNMLCIIAEAGADIVIIQKNGDNSYLSIDSKSEESTLYEAANSQAFPPDFSVLTIQKNAEKKANISQLYNETLTKTISTNTWITGELFKDSLKSPEDRGQNKQYIYNMFVRITGVEDKASYCSDLFHWKTNLENTGKCVFVLEDIPVPTTEEISIINKNNYNNINQLLMDLSVKIKSLISPEIENQARKAFVEVLLKENETDLNNLNRLKNKAIYIICWFQRYQKQIFRNYTNGIINTFVYFGVCKNNFESLFLTFLSKLPLDIFVINPDLSLTCKLESNLLFDKKYEVSFALKQFPINPDDVSYGTIAYHAEQDLNSIIYQDSGLYRNQQYKKAIAVSLQTIYEEIYILWNQEIKYRPNFEVLENKVILPTIISKISGVKDKNLTEYWKDIRKLVVDDTIVITAVPYMNHFNNPNSQSSSLFLKNKELDKNKIKNHSSYQYGIFREEIQNYMLEKLQDLLDSGLMKGTFTQGMEYTIISVILNLNKEITRLIQKIDFTKKLPKLLMICTDEHICSLEDSIIIAYLHLIGFDIVIFVPTGYQVIEKYYSQPLFIEHQIGEYMYDLKVPNLKSTSNSHPHESIIDKIFKRGR